MRDIRTVALEAVATIERDVIEASAIEDGTPYVGLENIQSGGDFVDVRQVSTGELASSKFAFTPQHLLYGKLRPYLAKIARPNFGGICSTDILPVLPGPDLDRRYLAHFLLRPESVAWATSRATGANLPRLSPRALAEMQIPVPPLPEQRRIADVLDQADALRAKRRAVLAQLHTLSQSMFLDIFGDPAANPMNWRSRQLGELIADGPQNGLYRPAEDYGSGTPIVRIDAIYDGVLTGLARLKRVRASDRDRNLFAVRQGDILINRVNSREYLGKSALVPALSEPTVFESNMMRFEVDRAVLDPGFLIEYLQTGFFRKHVIQSAKDAVNQSSINQEDVKALLVFVPPLLLQRSFVRLVAARDDLAGKCLGSLAQLDALFASLQQRAFQGEL